MKVSNFLLIITVVAVVPGALTAREPLDSINLGNYDAALEYVKNEPQDLNESVNDTLENGRGALHILARNKAGDGVSIELIRELVAGGADVNAQDASDLNRTPLHIAIALKQTAIALELCKFGANVNLQTSSGSSTLYYAAQTGDLAVVTAMLEQENVEIDIDAATEDGYTPLHTASLSGHHLVVEALIDGGANILLKTNESEGSMTALHLAACYGRVDAARILLARGTPVDVLDQDGCTPLHWAARKGHVAMVELLCDSGAQIDKLDGRLHASPFYYARMKKRDEVCKLLYCRGAHLIGNVGEHNHLYCILASVQESLFGR